MKKERVRTKRGFKGFGVFILGWFIGFICTLGILVGVGYWAYTSISVKRIEKWTKSDITDNKGIEDLTLQKAVGIIQSISTNGSDAYTLNKLEEDFGISLLGNSLYGISLDIIKSSPIKELKQAIDDTIDTATFNNVLNFMGVEGDDLGLLDTVLNKEVTYYVANGKLYTDEGHNIEVGFDYTIDGSTVEFANGTHTVSSGTIKPRIMDLPLNTALTSMSDATHDLKIHEVMGYHYDNVTDKYYETYNETTNTYSDEVGGIMASLAEYTVSDLSDNETFEGIYIYEVMGYDRTGTAPNYIYMDGETQVTGVMKSLAGKTIGELSNDETFNGMYIHEVMDYHYNTGDGKYYQDYDGTNYSNLVTGTMKALAGKTIGELSDPNTINNMKIYEVLGYTRAGVEGSYTYTTETGSEVTGAMKALAGKSVGELSDPNTISTMKIYEIFGYTYESGKYYNDGVEVTGTMKYIAGKTIDELSNPDTINNMKIYEVMGYDRTGTEGNYTYTNNGVQVTDAMMLSLAETKVNEIEGTIKNLKATDVINASTPIFNLFTTAELETLTIVDLPDKVVDKINEDTMTIGKLIDADILIIEDEHGQEVVVSDTIRAMTISQLIKYTMTVL